MKLDHVVIVVKDLGQAVADYQQLGFMVTPGGEHADGQTHNALIGFADGSYLELIAFRAGVAAESHPWWRFVGTGGGFADWALHTEDVTAAVGEMQALGLPYAATRDGGRLRPDDVRLQWRGTMPAPERGLPFLIEDLTPRDLRVPSGPSAAHANGAVAVAAVVVGVPDLHVAAHQYASLLSAPLVDPVPDPLLAALTIPFRCGGTSVLITSAEAGPIHERVERAGPGPYALLIATTGERSGWLDPERCHGAALRLQPAS